MALAIKQQSLFIVHLIQEKLIKDMKWLMWEKGRQKSGYDKMLIASLPFPIPFDFYILRFPEGSEIKPHTDPTGDRRHYRLNWIIKPAQKGGSFVCNNCIIRTRHFFLFRPDIEKHAVTKIEKGTRYVISIGWLRK